MKILVILDIDETILHLVTGRHIIPSDYNYDAVKIDDTSTIYYRPGFTDFLQFAKNNRHWLTLGIWTAGNKIYADMNYRFLLQRYELPEDMFLLVYSDTEIKHDLKNGLFEKDLRRVFMTHPEFTLENTFLVDNLYSNICHRANKENGIIVEWFVPTNVYYNPWQDYVFDDLQYICKQLQNVKNSGINVFHKLHATTTGLHKYLTHVMVGGEKTHIMSLGNVTENEYFQVVRGGGNCNKNKTRKTGCKKRHQQHHSKPRRNTVNNAIKHGNNTI